MAATQHMLDAEEAAALQGKVSVAEAARKLATQEAETLHASQVLDYSSYRPLATAPQLPPLSCRPLAAAPQLPPLSCRPSAPALS